MTSGILSPLRIALIASLAWLSVAATPLSAQSFTELPPLTAEPKVLLAAAAKADAKEMNVVYLLDAATFSFESDGLTRSVWHQIEYVATEDGVESAGSISAWWSPWYDQKPSIEARVIAKDGTVHVLDPKAIAEATASLDPDIFSDQRVLHAPLPGVAAGSIIESVITLEGRSAIRGGGKYGRFNFGAGVVVEHSRLVLDAASKVTPRFVNKSGLQPRTVEAGGRKRIIFEKDRSEPIDDEEDYLPSDDLAEPYVAFSTGTSWHDMAVDYGRIVDQQIAGNDLKEAVTSAVGGATERKAVVERLLDLIARNVRYAGVEVAEGSIVPRPPKSVLQLKYGDCKDKATLLVAMLRTAGIAAHVALLDAGSGFDTLVELPGINHFNHVIVLVDGEPALWVDPTDEFARAGELPIEDQGRMALVAADTTTTLARTPEAPAAANQYNETRTFTLPEDGSAHVVEVTDGTWAEDDLLRRGAARSEKKAYREDLEKYAIAYYAAPKLDSYEVGDPHDLARPFRLSLQISKSKSGVVSGGEGDVLIPVYNIVRALPVELRNYEEPSAEAKTPKSEKPRVHDFVFPRPVTRSWTYRIIPATGFVPRTLPKNEKTALGAMSLTTAQSIEADGTVVVKLTFESGKRRLTPAEFAETRIAVSKLAHRDGVHIGFQSVGQAKLSSGDIGGALAEFRKLAALHPKEAQHHIDLARALETGGLGDAARAEAQLAVKIEPSNAQAHVALASALEHDALGRVHRGRWDVAGAVAELRKAKELEPTNLRARFALAQLLTYGESGFRFEPGAHLDQAIDEYNSVLKEFGADAAAYRRELLLTLSHAGRWSDVKEVARAEVDADQRDQFLIAAAVVTEGSKAGLRELGAFDAAKRRSYGASVAQLMIALRRYSDAADLFEEVGKGSEQASQLLGLIQVLRKTGPWEKALDDSPRSLMLKVMQASLTRDNNVKALYTPEVAAMAEQASTFSVRALSSAEMTPTMLLDLAGSVIEVQQDGNDDIGYRLRIRSAAGTPTAAMSSTIYAVRRNGKLLIAAFSDHPEMIGASVQKLADDGALDAARVWLNWARESIPAGGGDDPLSGPPFARLWAKEKPAATRDEIRLAAAALTARSKELGSDAAATLSALRDKAPTDEARTAVDLALIEAYIRAHDWPKLLPISERLAKAYPDSGSAFHAWMRALVGADMLTQADAAVEARLANRPKDQDAIRAKVNVAARRGDYETAELTARRLVDESNPTIGDYNDAAWLALFRGKDLDRAIDDARRATPDENRADPGILHTLASLYAESGKSVEARQALLKSIDRRVADEPRSVDWFVLGRIAENYGIPDAALSAYKRVEKEEVSGLSTWELTQRRIKRLVAN